MPYETPEQEARRMAEGQSADAEAQERAEQAINERTLSDLHDHIVKAFNTVNYLIEEDSYEGDITAAWKDGYECAEEDLSAKITEDFRDLSTMVALSTVWDNPLKPEEVRRIWDDRFLTNVIIPFLEHIREDFRHIEARFLLRDRRLTAVEVKEFQEILHIINSLTTTIHQLSEWRG